MTNVNVSQPANPLTPNVVGRTLQSAWEQQSIWSTVASQLKTRLTRARVISLSLVIAAAVAGVISAQLLSVNGTLTMAGRVVGFVSAALLAIVAFLRSRLLGKDQVERWIRARSASEGLKEAVYRYLTRTGDYADADRDEKLGKKVDAILLQVSNLVIVSARVEPKQRALPNVSSLATYVAERIEPQIGTYYRKRALELSKRLDAWRTAELTLSLIGAVLGASAALVSKAAIAPWVAVITTITGAIVSHIEASRYEQLVISYSATAQRLQSLRDRWADSQARGALSPAAESDFVRQFEDAISAENQAWVADWSKAAAASK